jgi:hypothetical protein
MRCRMHGGALGSGAPKGNRNARKHGLFAKSSIAEQRQIMTLLGEARKLLDEMRTGSRPEDLPRGSPSQKAINEPYEPK